MSTKHIGCFEGSYGYRTDGKIYSESNTGSAFSVKFSLNSTVGCGYIHLQKKLFFTLDGKMLGYAFHNIKSGEYYPSVSLHSSNEEVKFNVYNDLYKFDIQAMIIVL